MTDRETLTLVTQQMTDYRQCFGSPAGQRVLVDLVDFCQAALTTMPSGEGVRFDMNRAMVLEGRRQVFLRIQTYLNLTPEQLFLLAVGRPYQQGEQDAA